MICPRFGFEINGEFTKAYCINCPDVTLCHEKPRFEPLGKVDIFKLAELLQEKEKTE